MIHVYETNLMTRYEVLLLLAGDGHHAAAAEVLLPRGGAAGGGAGHPGPAALAPSWPRRRALPARTLGYVQRMLDFIWGPLHEAMAKVTLRAAP